MSLIKNNNFADRAEDKLQQKDRDYLVNVNLAKCIVSEVQEVEDAMYEVYTQFGVYNAIGAQLDIVGSLVGESRVGRSDEAYRTAILARIQLNVGAGEPDTIINAIKQWMNPTIVDFSEPYPAYFTLFIQSAINIPNIATIVKEISPAGIGSTVTTLPAGLIPFQLGTAKGQPSILKIRTDPIPAPLDTYAISGTDTLKLMAIDVYNYPGSEGLGTVYLTKAELVIDNIGTKYSLGDGNTLELKLTNANEDYTISTFGGRLSTVRI